MSLKSTHPKNKDVRPSYSACMKAGAIYFSEKDIQTMQARKPHKSEIIESTSIRDIIEHVTFNSWVLVDLDETLQVSIIELACSKWFDEMMEHHPDATALVIAVYHEVQHYIRTIPVEQEAVKVIKSLQDVGIPVLGITSRDHKLSKTTFRQLHEHQFTLKPHSKNSPIHLSKDDIKCVLDGNILFCNGKEKGICFDMLLDFLKNLTEKDIIEGQFDCDLYLELPENVTMADDKKKHLESVKQILDKRKIGFTGIRYGYLDKQVQQTDIERAHVQLHFLKDRLPSSTQIMIEKLNIKPSQIMPEDEKYLDCFYPYTHQHENNPPADEIRDNPSPQMRR